MTDIQIVDGVPQILPTDVPAGARLLDVRQPEEYAAGHAPGAVSIPLGELRDRVAEIPEGDGPLHVICLSGGRSQRAAAFLAEHGIEVANVVGGTGGWAQAGLDLLSETGDEPQIVKPSTPPPAQV